MVHEESKGCAINDQHVLDGLQPHPNLKTLEVKNYLGTRFSSWFSEESLPNLVKLKLSGCKRCIEIPPLGQLKFLRHLELIGLLELEFIGPTFYGVEVNDNGSNLTSLVNLRVYFVKELTCLPDEMLRNNVSLQHLWVSVCEIKIYGFGIEALPHRFGDLTSLERFTLVGCKRLQHLDFSDAMPKLRYLWISDCPLLEALSDAGMTIGVGYVRQRNHHICFVEKQNLQP
uniref:Cc-nbs-lrr resistance protein n=1 Tax=Solanum tuberosum TaxID=4113 RepID=M0ZZD1_SOLTU